MRNLTITRNKSFVGCAMKDQVYVQDDLAPELTISGVPCRKIGEIKNGETKTFQIGEGELQVFLIADKLSKDYCHGTVTVPQGQEDVSYSGKHAYTFGSNPFRFDGVIYTEEQLAEQKKQARKGSIITVIAVVVGLIVGSLASGAFHTASPKTFTKDDFQITLTDEFSSVGVDGFYAAYQSKSVLLFAQREAKADLDEMTLAEYGALVCELNEMTDADMHQGSDFYWFSFTKTVDGEDVYYVAVCCEGTDAFWIVNFATPVSNRDTYHDTFLEWAESIAVK
ncbi:MAG: hypothetical protein IKU07_03850 [Oscillospiraceae bacterium]|nr:hypothetical protein [Oscillospiraceae bacterium]